MAPDRPRVGFYGFGEAGQAFAKGLHAEGLTELVGYSAGPRNHPPYSEGFRARAAQVGVRLVERPEDLIGAADVIFSAVPVRDTLKVAEGLAAALPPSLLYVDLNACSPAMKKQAAEVIGRHGVQFADAAVMGAVSIYGHGVAIYASGSGAEALARVFAPFGMNVHVVAGGPGVAATLKMLRSIVTKGSAQLLSEAMLAAKALGVEEVAFEVICGPMDKVRYSDFANMCLTTDAIHAARRGVEMDDVAETLRGLGIAPVLSEAVHRRYEWLAATGIKERLAGRIPKDWRDVLRALGETKSSS
jgi:3-hydroxyisobutyrate dehydrogenase-like beta-hydroxyacid dehydrogenase